MLDEIGILRRVALARGHANDAASSAALRAIAGDVRALDQRAVRDGDDHALVGDQVLDRDLAFVGHDLRAALIAVLVLDGVELLLDDREHAYLLRENVTEILDLLQQFLVLADDLVALQAGQLIEAQLEDGVDLLRADEIAAISHARLIVDADAVALRLALGEIIRGQLASRFLAVGGTTDDLDHLVQIGQRDEIPLKVLGPPLRFPQVVPRAAHHDFAAMLDVAIDQLFQVERLRPSAVDGELVDGE